MGIIQWEMKTDCKIVYGQIKWNRLTKVKYRFLQTEAGGIISMNTEIVVKLNKYLESGLVEGR